MSATWRPLVPPYGERSLAEVIPSMLAAIGAPDAPNTLEIAPARSACLLLVDGLGWELLRRHASDAPFLGSLADGSAPLATGFPATTAVGLVTLGTGRTPGEHGVVGRAFEVPGVGLLDALAWRSHGPHPVDLLERLPPERVQPLDTLPQRAARVGIDVLVAGPRYQQKSGLTRAALRGAGFQVARPLGALGAALLDGTPGTFRYGYHGDLDLLGHLYGPGSTPWRLQLAQLDRLVASVAESLPPGRLLVVTGDHGMVEVPEAGRLDADSDPALRDGVRLLGGEVRARHVYARPGAAADVLASWRASLADQAWVLSRDEAVAAGWFGPTVADRVRHRIGDVVVALRGQAGVVSRTAEPLESTLLGQHGSLTADEQLVPLLTVRG